MKILLLGDFSGLHYNLKIGLEQHGCRVFLASDGDGHKKIPSDFTLFPFKLSLLGRILNIAHLYINIYKFVGYDMVQLISPFVIGTNLFSRIWINAVLQWNKNSALVFASLSDPLYLRICNRLKYAPYDNPEKFLRETFTSRRLNFFYNIVNKIELLIPCYYEAQISLDSYKNISSVIPLPYSNVNLLKQDHVVAKKNRVVILHGLLREEVKGTRFIVEAMKRLEEKYKDLIELQIVGHVSLKEYMEIFSKADIIVDQCRTYSYGMNAIMGLANGKVVLSGCEPELLNCFNVSQSPIVNIIPDSEQIFRELEKLINSPDLIQKLKQSSFTFFQEIHEANIVAKQYIERYRKF